MYQAEAGLHAVAGPDNDKRKSKVVPNSRDGVRELVKWCAKHGVTVDQVHVVLEATGPITSKRLQHCTIAA